MKKNDIFNFKKLVEHIHTVNQQLSGQASRAVNTSLTLRNWFIGGYIQEYELHGKDRAKYGEQLLSELSKALENVSNCNKRQLYRYVRFYRFYPQIVGTVSPQLMQQLPRMIENEGY